MAELRIKVDRVLYPQEGKEGEWMIIATDKGIIKGNLSWRPEKSELLILQGEYGTYQGKSEFKFSSARADVPIDARDQLRYVCEITPGFGLAMEEKIWNTWGEDWKEDAEPGIIRTLKGAKFELFANSVESLELKREESEAVTWMMSIGATVNMAQAAWQKWEKQAIGIVKANCYRLSDLPNYGFSHVDKSIRYKFGIDDADPRRVKAGVLYSIGQLTDNGSTLVSWYIIKDQVSNLLGGIAPEILNTCVRQMFTDGALVPFKETLDLTTARDYENAKIIWDFVNK